MCSSDLFIRERIPSRMNIGPPSGSKGQSLANTMAAESIPIYLSGDFNDAHLVDSAAGNIEIAARRGHHVANNSAA